MFVFLSLGIWAAALKNVTVNCCLGRHHRASCTVEIAAHRIIVCCDPIEQLIV